MCSNKVGGTTIGTNDTKICVLFERLRFFKVGKHSWCSLNGTHQCVFESLKEVFGMLLREKFCSLSYQNICIEKQFKNCFEVFLFGFVEG